MKTTLTILICLYLSILARADAPPPTTPVVIDNFSTNAVVLNLTDYFGNSSQLTIPVGRSFKQFITQGTLVHASGWTVHTPDNGQQMTVLVAGPYSDAGVPNFVVTTTPFPFGQPSGADVIEYWVWGVCTAIVFGLTGSMRRMLGRVHEVNTDL